MNLAGLTPNVMVFVLATAVGMIIKDLWDRCAHTSIAVEDDALSPSTDG